VGIGDSYPGKTTRVGNAKFSDGKKNNLKEKEQSNKRNEAKKNNYRKGKRRGKSKDLRMVVVG
jgi:hypothetical protein